MKKINLELTEKELVGLFFAANLGQMHFGKYPYEKKMGEEGYDDYRKEADCMYEGIYKLAGAALEEFGDTPDIYEKYLPSFGKQLRKSAEIANNA